MKKNNISKRLKKLLLRRGNQNGASLLFFISIILVISVLTVSMLELTTTSTLSEISFNHLQRAYFMAEAGGNYAKKIFNDGRKNDPPKRKIDNETFTVDGAGQFSIFANLDENNRIHSTGTINTGISSKVEVKLIYLLKGGGNPSSPFKESIFSGNKMELGDHVQITGDVGTNHTEISKGKKVSITGEEKTSMGKKIDPIKFSCSGCNSDYEIGEKGSTVWSEGTYKYKNVTMEKKSTLIITGNVILYVKEDFEADEKTTIEIRSGASLTIYVDGEAEFGEKFSVEFKPSPNRAEDFVIYGTSNADSIKFEEHTNFIGAIYAPNAEITIKKHSNITGAIIGDEIEVKEHVTIEFDEDVKKIEPPVGGTVKNGKWTITEQYFSQ